MQHIDPAAWKYLPGINISGKVFVARWLEAFHWLTIDTYRFRHLNLHWACDELLVVINAVEERKIDAKNVKTLADETWELLQKDSISDILFPNKQRYYDAFNKPLVDGKRVHPGFRILVGSLRKKRE